MNIYYCETCGVRISDADLPQGLPPEDERLKRCPKHRSPGSNLNVPIAPPIAARSSGAVIVPGSPPRSSGDVIKPGSPPRGSGAGMAPTRISSMRVRAPQKGGSGSTGAAHPSGRHGDTAAAQSNVTLKVIAGLGGLGVLVFIASLFSGSEKPSSTASKSGTSSSTSSVAATPGRGGTPPSTTAPQPAHTSANPPVPEKTPAKTPIEATQPAYTRPPVTPEPPPDPKETANRAPQTGPMGFMSGDTGDIREELAQDRLAALTALEKDGKHTAQQLRAAYRKFIAANTSTKAAKEVENRMKALPAAPAYVEPGPKDGLVGCWNWDDEGRDVPDRSGHEVDGEIDGAERTADKPPALSFDGNGNAVRMPNEPYRAVTKSFTLLCWAKPNSGRNKTSESLNGAEGTRLQRYAIFPQQGEIAYGKGHAGVGVSIGTNGVSVFEHSAGYLPSPLVYEAAISDWTHVAVVYDNNKSLLYVNGALAKEGLTSAMTTHPGSSLGGSQYGWYRGLLGEVRVYNRALSADEIKALFDLGRR